MFIADDIDGEEEVDFVALVESPAIQRNFLAFGDQFVEPTQGESKNDFMPRCIEYIINEGKESEQAVAICSSLWEQHFAGTKISFDYDDTLSTAKGKELAIQKIDAGEIVYIISARSQKENLIPVANELGIPLDRVYAVGSNSAKIDKIKELGISKHYDNNAEVISKLGSIGEKFLEVQIVCKECGHSWDYKEGGEDPYTCHMCGGKEEAFESYNDYPQSAKDNAERGIRLNEEIGNRCATQVGKVRAQQIMNGENLSMDTIKRTYSYLSRAAEYYNPDDTEACGTISYLLWGGEPMLRWAESKMNQEEFSAHLSFAVQDEDQRIVSGPLMIADLPIYRRDEDGEYYVMFTGEQIKKIVQRFFKKGYQAKVNIEHGKKAEGVYMFESYIIDRDRGVNPPTGFEDVADGSWFGSFKVENDKLWGEVKAGTFKGFSVEGLFRYEKAGMIVQKEEQIMAQIFKILEQIEQ
jgi:hypothetical protein